MRQTKPFRHFKSQSNALSKDGTAALATTAFSRDGKYFAYGVSLSGSDFYTIYVRPTENAFPYLGSTTETPKPENEPGFKAESEARGLTAAAEDKGRLADEVRFVKFSGITWTHDSKGFFYQVRTEGPFPKRSSLSNAYGYSDIQHVRSRQILRMMH